MQIASLVMELGKNEIYIYFYEKINIKNSITFLLSCESRTIGHVKCFQDIPSYIEKIDHKNPKKVANRPNR
jgi:hypothetical protein